MNKHRLRKSVVFALIALAIGALPGCSSVDKQANVGSESKTFKLSSAPSGQYEPREIRVRGGTKVRIEGDPTTLTGGMDTLVIEGYGISKKISQADFAVEFVADKPGEFKMRCANYMGNGKLIVER